MSPTRWFLLPLVGLLGLQGCNGKSIEIGDSGPGCTEINWYADGDGDGYGEQNGAVAACDAPKGHVEQGGDCDDSNPEISPGAREACNGYDDDCDGAVDDDDPMAYGSRTWWRDRDGDHYGVETETAFACIAPAGYASATGDCDDDEPSVHPKAEETCGDGVDSDCDGEDPTCPR